jgi:hypothetical protein
MEAEGASLDSPRKLTLVMSRLSPLSEGKSVRFRFSGDKIEIIEEEKKEKGGE